MGRRIATLAALGAFASMAQRTEISAVGGIGYAAGDQGRGGGAAVGFAGFGAARAISGAHGIAMDYVHADYRSRTLDNNFLTLSYIRQPMRAGIENRLRPFVQIGAGLNFERTRTGGMFGGSKTDTDFALIFGGGFSYDIGWSMFVAPQVRCYATVGPTITVLPTVAVGWRF